MNGFIQLTGTKKLILSGKTQVSSQTFFKKSYPDICIFNVVDSITSFTDKTYKFASSFALMVLTKCSINCFFDKGTGPSLLQESFNESDRLPSTRI